MRILALARAIGAGLGHFRRDHVARSRGGGSIVCLAAMLAASSLARPARACSADNPDAVIPTALPRDGATEVPTATSFVIVSGRMPTEVALTAGGVDVPLGAPAYIGVGQSMDGDELNDYWQVKATAFLPASSTLVLSMADPHGGRVVLTTIQTAAGYDKAPGTPATLKSLTLTRVRYPLSEIASGDCVFSEYMGYISFDYDAGMIPGTPADSIVNTITLWAQHGGAADQGWTFAGPRAWASDPPGDFQPFSSGEWSPFLDPTLTYCAAITSFGQGDLARLPVVSNMVCAKVDQVSMPGAGDPDAGPPEPSVGDGGAGLDAGDASLVTTADAGTPDAIAADAPAASADGAVTTGGGGLIDAGCGCAAAPGQARWLALALAALAAGATGRRRRRSRARVSGGRRGRRS
jgi:MYXO-CTERM domain-containing protein